MRRGRLTIVGCLVAMALAGCESASENAGSTAGPNVDIRCLKAQLERQQRLALLPGQGSATGVGDTDVEIQCAPPS